MKRDRRKTKRTRRKLRMNTPRTSALLVRLQPDALAAMRESAHHLDLSMSAMIAKAVAAFLDREAARLRRREGAR